MEDSSKIKVGSGPLHLHTLQLVNGIVKAYFPRIGLYTVSLRGQLANCYSLNYSGGMGFGMYAKGTYSPGDSVFCIFNESQGEGVIIGALPRDYTVDDIGYSVSGSSTIGLNQKGSARAGLICGPVSGCTKEEPGIIVEDAHCGVYDLMPGGSFNISSETGVRFFADPYSMGMQTDDATGLWVYSDDSYMRQASINFQQVTGGKVEEDFNDNGELNETVGHSMFSWELLGYTEKPEESITFDENLISGKSVGSGYEPKENAKPFHRVVEYNGYLGHGYQRVVNAPPNEAPDAYAYGAENKDQYCLSRISQFVDGEVSIESAKSIILSKKCFIPCVQTMELSDDFDGGAGDSSSESQGEYDFTHSDVKVVSSPEFNAAGTCELLQELMALTDYQAHLFNYKLVHPFVYHKKDYYVTDDLTDTTLPTPQYKSWFSTLKAQQFAEAPETVDLDIHAKLKSTYYASESGLAFLPEGGVSLYGGYGEEVRMGAGSSTLSAPGDIWIKAGRNIHLWAGKDIILKAKNCIEESASDGSVRIKAENNLELLGGNNESTGGVLIESKGSGDFDFSESGEKVKVGGLILRASKGTAVLEGENTYIRSGIENNEGTLVLDAGQPYGTLNLCGGRIINYLSHVYAINKGTFDSPEAGEVTSVLTIQQGATVSEPGSLMMALNVSNNGSITTTDGIICGGSIIVKNTCATLLESESMIMPVGKKASEKYEQLLDKIEKQLDGQVTVYNANYKELSDKIYNDNKVGNQDRLLKTGFSYRTEEEYGTSDVKIYADRWQNIAYITGSTTDTWEETKVTTTNEIGQYPYPGDKFYNSEEETCLVYQPSLLYNEEPYAYKKRQESEEISEDYTNAKYAEPETKSLNEYMIIGGEND